MPTKYSMTPGSIGRGTAAAARLPQSGGGQGGGMVGIGSTFAGPSTAMLGGQSGGLYGGGGGNAMASGPGLLGSGSGSGSGTRTMPSNPGYSFPVEPNVGNFNPGMGVPGSPQMPVNQMPTNQMPTSPWGGGGNGYGFPVEPRVGNFTPGMPLFPGSGGGGVGGGGSVPGSPQMPVNPSGGTATPPTSPSGGWGYTGGGNYPGGAGWQAAAQRTGMMSSPMGGQNILYGQGGGAQQGASFQSSGSTSGAMSAGGAGGQQPNAPWRAGGDLQSTLQQLSSEGWSQPNQSGSTYKLLDSSFQMPVAGENGWRDLGYRGGSRTTSNGVGQGHYSMTDGHTTISYDLGPNGTKIPVLADRNIYYGNTGDEAYRQHQDHQARLLADQQEFNSRFPGLQPQQSGLQRQPTSSATQSSLDPQSGFVSSSNLQGDLNGGGQWSIYGGGQGSGGAEGEQPQGQSQGGSGQAQGQPVGGQQTFGGFSSIGGSPVNDSPQVNNPSVNGQSGAGVTYNPSTGRGSTWDFTNNPGLINEMMRLHLQQSGGINRDMPVGSGGGGRGSGSVTQSGDTGLLVPDLYQRAWEEARGANEQRYQDILQGYKDMYEGSMDWQGRSANNLINQYDERYKRNMETAAGLGAQELKDIQDRYTAERGRADQDMINRGLGNTTVREGAYRGLARGESDALGSALDRINRLKLQTDIGLSGDALANQQGLHGERLGLMTELPQRNLDFMERRTDSYPSLDQLLNLALRYGNAEGNQGGGVVIPGGGGLPPGGGTMPGGGTLPGGGTTPGGGSPPFEISGPPSSTLPGGTPGAGGGGGGGTTPGGSGGGSSGGGGGGGILPGTSMPYPGSPGAIQGGGNNQQGSGQQGQYPAPGAPVRFPDGELRIYHPMFGWLPYTPPGEEEDEEKKKEGEEEKGKEGEGGQVKEEEEEQLPYSGPIPTPPPAGASSPGPVNPYVSLGVIDDVRKLWAQRYPSAKMPSDEWFINQINQGNMGLFPGTKTGN